MNQPWLYIVLIGVVIIVYAMILPSTREPKRRDQAMLSEMEETMEHFAAELEEQNQALIRMFADTKKEYEIHSAKLAARVELLEKQNDQLQQNVSKISYEREQGESRPSSGSSYSALSGEAAALSERQSAVAEAETGAAEQPQAALEPIATPAALMNIKQRYSELFELYDQGKSSDAIAKKLGMNKGEIHLILQLAKREEQADV
ncbi:hypothetical protein O9H85_07840 [Paenibacillus filicis]|uniref:Uncharacterized protein n=1 Tax=Paenibacillus gyeongsangnamensis TaxID=3388067 RepID=A0ABT4Q652_9BACL|nr:hypothetical protein [Paenibacillus filicis]MCZ8512342.1 hypothetical protein [Paenibacillus filicis]